MTMASDIAWILCPKSFKEKNKDKPSITSTKKLGNWLLKEHLKTTGSQGSLNC